MNQYCRYCSYCCYGDVVYCEVKNKTMSEQKAKRKNTCKDFIFNEMDVFNPSNLYKPREDKPKINQRTLFDYDEVEDEKKR